MSNLQKSVSEHRVFVLTALERVENGEMATTVLQDAPAEYHGLCQEILLGIQRWKGSLDRMIQSNVKRTPKLWIRRLLRMALYELYFLQRPGHAVINESVELCKQSKYRAQAGFVNAVLDRYSSPMRCMRMKTPQWLKELWAQNGKWLKSMQVPPKSGRICFTKDRQWVSRGCGHPLYDRRCTRRWCGVFQSKGSDSKLEGIFRGTCGS